MRLLCACGSLSPTAKRHCGGCRAPLEGAPEVRERTCASCRRDNPPPYTFCVACGELLPEGLRSGSVHAAPSCARCGARCAGHHRFCVSCGARQGALDDGEAPCRRCGAGNPAAARYCVQCGEPTARSRLGRATPPMGLIACTRCGAVREGGVRFCTQCGLAHPQDAAVVQRRVAQVAQRLAGAPAGYRGGAPLGLDPDGAGLTFRDEGSSLRLRVRRPGARAFVVELSALADPPVEPEPRSAFARLADRLLGPPERPPTWIAALSVEARVRDAGARPGAAWAVLEVDRLPEANDVARWGRLLLDDVVST